MLVAAAVCPLPPLLVPTVAGALAPDLDACRDACRSVVATLRAAAPDRVVLVGAGTQTRAHPPTAAGSLAPYGIALRLGTADGPVSLPLSLGIARWVYDTYAPGGPPALAQEIGATATAQECADTGAALVEGPARVALLVAADGSAYPLQTPVGDDGRGGAYDDRVAAALGEGDAQALLALDAADDGPLWVAGRPGLQTLAGALAGRRWSGQVVWRGAPYGVGYLVAQLLPA